MVDQWLDVDGISYHFDATGALIEQKDADGNVTVITTASSGSSATPVPSLWWFIAGGGVLVVLAGGAMFLRRRKGRGFPSSDEAVVCVRRGLVRFRCPGAAARGGPPARSPHSSLRLGVIDLEARPGLAAAPGH